MQKPPVLAVPVHHLNPIKINRFLSAFDILVGVPTLRRFPRTLNDLLFNRATFNVFQGHLFLASPSHSTEIKRVKID